MTVSVGATAGCSWSATSGASWIHVSGAGSGVGNGTVNLSVDANSGPARNGTVTIAGLPFQIFQDGTSCAISLAPDQAADTDMPASGGSGYVYITASDSSCPWTVNASPNFSTSDQGGQGDGGVPYTIGANPLSTSRIVTATIGGQVFTVLQAGSRPCSYTLPQSSQSVPASGGGGSVPVVAAGGCSWGANNTTPGPSWISLSSSTGSGNGSFTFGAAQNPSTSPRVGTISVNGQTFVINQAGAAASQSCTVAANGNPFVPVEGRTVQPGDLTVTCSGLTANVTADVVLMLSASVTNQLVACPGGTSPTCANGAQLLVNGANPVAGQVLGYNKLVWPGVVLPKGSSGSVTLRLTGELVDASGSLQTTITGQVSISSHAGNLPVTTGALTIATLAHALVFQKGAPGALNSVQRTVAVAFQEGGTNAFHYAGAGNPGTTRLRLSLTNIPANAQVWAPLNPLEAGGGVTYAQLVSADVNGLGGSAVTGSARPPAAGTFYQLPVSNGVAAATWEMTTASVPASQTLTFNMLVENASSSDMSQIVASAGGTLAPVSTVAAASTTAPIPRFRDFAAAQPFANLPVVVTACPTSGCGPSGADLGALTAGGNVSWTVGVNCDTSTGCPGENDVDIVATGGQSILGCAGTGGSCAQSGSSSYVLTCLNMSAGGTCSAVVTTQPATSSNPSLNGAPRSPNQPVNPNGGGTTNAPVSTVATNPPGLQVTVNSVPATSPATYDWNLAEFHMIDAEPQVSPDGGTSYVFDSWSDGGAQSHTVQATFWATYTANFDVQQYLLTTSVTPTGGGTIGYTCTPSTACTLSGSNIWVNPNQSVTLSANATSGYQLSGWTLDGSPAGTSANLAVLMGGPHSVTATFIAAPGPVTIQTSPAGLQFSVDGGAAQTAPKTLSLSLGPHTIAVATTQPGSAGTQYVFTGWSDSGAASHSITVGTSAATYTASFKTQYLLTISASPGAGGTVTPASGTFYDSGTVVNIQATANTGYSFTSWSGNVAGASNSATTVTMTAPQTVTANFSSLTGVTIQTNPTGLQFSVDGGAAQTAPQTLNLSQGSHTIAVATTQAGSAGTQYVFTGWSDSGAASHSIAVGASAATYTASFKTQYQLTISASPAAGGTVTPASGGFYDSATVVNIQATANTGYSFTNWTGSVASASNASTTVTMSAPQTVTANFSP